VELCKPFIKYVEEVFDAFAENASAPLMFMGKDIAGVGGAMFDPPWIREKVIHL
jgi:hypothetical protein